MSEGHGARPPCLNHHLPHDVRILLSRPCPWGLALGLSPEELEPTWNSFRGAAYFGVGCGVLWRPSCKSFGLRKPCVSITMAQLCGCVHGRHASEGWHAVPTESKTWAACGAPAFVCQPLTHSAAGSSAPGLVVGRGDATERDPRPAHLDGTAQRISVTRAGAESPGSVQMSF